MMARLCHMLHNVRDMARKPYNDEKQQLSKNQRNALKFICLINQMLCSQQNCFHLPTTTQETICMFVHLVLIYDM